MICKVDIDLLRRFQPGAEALVAPPEGCFTNWLGLFTEAGQFGTRDAIIGTIRGDVASGGDGVYGGYAEYAGLLRAIEAATPRREFTAVELGAGWGPWISAAGVACQRLGFERIRLVGVEAETTKCRMMQAHMERNGLIGPPAIGFRCVNAAAWKEDGEVYFSVIDSVRDHGGAAAEATSATDYRGFAASHKPVAAVSIPTLCRDYALVDFMHWDIQGAEADVAEAAIEFLNERVRRIFIGTHSRAVEGRLLTLFHKHQWDVDWFRECNFNYDRSRPTLEAMGTSDGELSLVNPRIAAA